jgi:beta-glucosidase/6-phospho-beta-glucosidase/beta-galactosidase
VTLHHYDTPQWVQDEGGFLNENVAKYFELYADTVFKTLGMQVGIWMTFNEPDEFCNGYESSSFPPMINKPGEGSYQCAHNVLIAHAAAYHLYKRVYAQDQRGMIGITLDGRFYFPKDSSVDQSVIDRALNFETGWFAHPIYSESGGYPQMMIDEINSRSKREGRPWSRLPVMSERLKKYIRGTADFLGYNYYSSRLAQLDSSDYDPTKPPNRFKDSRIITSVDPSWKQAKSKWLYNVPDGLRGLLNWLKKEYNNTKVLITENGWSDNGELEDNDRIDYLKSHLIAVSKAISEDGCNVIGHTTWSIIDNFEWLRGYSEHFGLHAVNLTSPEKERIPKKSVGFLKKVIENGFV